MITVAVSIVLDLLIRLLYTPGESLLWRMHFAYNAELIDNFHFVFFSCAPLAILVVKNYRYHWLLFSGLNFFSASIYLLNHFDLSYIEFLIFETTLFILSGTLVSIAVHFSQMTLGKWLLPERYGRRPGGGTDGMAA
jgi:nicotinamide riboside transporter PnuC